MIRFAHATSNIDLDHVTPFLLFSFQSCGCDVIFHLEFDSVKIFFDYRVLSFTSNHFTCIVGYNSISISLCIVFNTVGATLSMISTATTEVNLPLRLPQTAEIL